MLVVASALRPMTASFMPDFLACRAGEHAPQKNGVNRRRTQEGEVTNTCALTLQPTGAWEVTRSRGREAGHGGGREVTREGGRSRGREARHEGGRHVTREGGRPRGREAGHEGGRQVTREGGAPQEGCQGARTSGSVWASFFSSTSESSHAFLASAWLAGVLTTLSL